MKTSFSLVFVLASLTILGTVIWFEFGWGTALSRIVGAAACLCALLALGLLVLSAMKKRDTSVPLSSPFDNKVLHRGDGGEAMKAIWFILLVAFSVLGITLLTIIGGWQDASISEIFFRGLLGAGFAFVAFTSLWLLRRQTNSSTMSNSTTMSTGETEAVP